MQTSGCRQLHGEGNAMMMILPTNDVHTSRDGQMELELPSLNRKGILGTRHLSTWRALPKAFTLALCPYLAARRISSWP